MKHEEGYFTGTRGYQVYYQAWLPEGEMRGSVQVVHGFAEHSGRYLNVVNKLVPAGFAVFADDHCGHGKTEGTRLYVKKWEDFYEDERLFRATIEEKYPEVAKKPRFLLGHSMGSLISYHYVLNYPEDFKALVLSGFGTENGAEVSGFLKAISKLVSKIAPKLKIDPKLGSDFISRDPEVVKAYENDPLVVIGSITTRLGAEMMKAQDKVVDLAPAFPNGLPLLIQCGSADTAMVGHENFDGMFKNVKDYTKKIYDGLYHEVYNELEADREVVLNDLLSFLQAHL